MQIGAHCRHAHFDMPLPEHGRRFIAAKLAKPREQQCFATKRAHFAHHNAHGALHDLFGQVRVVIGTRPCESKQPRKILFEEPVERLLIAARDAGRELPVLCNLRGIVVHGTG